MESKTLDDAGDNYNDGEERCTDGESPSNGVYHTCAQDEPLLCTHSGIQFRCVLADHNHRRLPVWVPVLGCFIPFDQGDITPSLVSISSPGYGKSPEPDRLYVFMSWIVKSYDRYFGSSALTTPEIFKGFRDWRAFCLPLEMWWRFDDMGSSGDGSTGMVSGRDYDGGYRGDSATRNFSESCLITLFVWRFSSCQKSRYFRMAIR